jgi:hypothetical protein
MATPEATPGLHIPDAALAALFDAAHVHGNLVNLDHDAARAAIRAIATPIVVAELRAIAAANTEGAREFRVMPSDLLRIADELELESDAR